MNPRVFKNLARRFSGFAEDPERARDEDVDVEEIMESAGKVLLKAIRSREIQFYNMPEWLTKEPHCKREDPSAVNNWEKNVAFNYHEYWRAAIRWIEEHVSDSGIVLPYGLKYPHTTDDIHLIAGDYPSVPSVIRGKHEGIWVGVAKASAEACLFLADILSYRDSKLIESLGVYETAKRLAETYGLSVRHVRIALARAYWGPQGKKADRPVDPFLRTEVRDGGGRKPQYFYCVKRAKPILEQLAKKHK